MLRLLPSLCIYWLKENGRIKIKASKGRLELTISQLVPEDMADYTCKATNKIGSNERTGSVTVNCKSDWLLYARLYCRMYCSFSATQTYVHVKWRILLNKNQVILMCFQTGERSFKCAVCVYMCVRACMRACMCLWKCRLVCLCLSNKEFSQNELALVWTHTGERPFKCGAFVYNDVFWQKQLKTFLTLKCFGSCTFTWLDALFEAVCDRSMNDSWRPYKSMIHGYRTN